MIQKVSLNMRMWHLRDVLCWFKLKFSKNGYAVKEFCGKCEKCNGLFGACGVIPCPMRFDKSRKITASHTNEDTPEDVSLPKQNIRACEVLLTQMPYEEGGVNGK